MPRPRRNTSLNRQRIDPYTAPVTFSHPQPLRSHLQQQTLPIHTTSISRNEQYYPSHLDTVPSSLRTLLNPQPLTGDYPYMSRSNHPGFVAAGGGSRLDDSNGDPFSYPAHASRALPPQPPAAALYTLPNGHNNFYPTYGYPSTTHLPLQQAIPPPVGGGMHASSAAPSGYSRPEPEAMSPKASASHAQQQLADEDDDADGAGKRRRVQRACDVCRRKKVRCDGPQPGKGACSNCLTCNQICRFEEATKRRAPPRSYTEALETRMDKIERLLDELAPGIDFSDRIGQPVRLPDDPNKEKDANKPGSPPRPFFVKPPIIPEPSSPAQSLLPLDVTERDTMISRLGGKLRIKSEEPQEPVAEHEDDQNSCDSYNDAEDVAYVSSRAPAGPVPEVSSTNITSTICGPVAGSRTLSDEQQGKAASFIGHSSAFHLIPALERMNKKTELTDHLATTVVARIPNLPGMRPEYWAVPRCLTASLWDEEHAKDLDMILHVWPAPDLEAKLVDAYFGRPHKEYPVLLEPQFRAELKDLDKRKDREWANLAMSVFAVASLYCDDERVAETSYNDDFLQNTRGAKWYNSCRRIGFRLTWSIPTLRHTQFILLLIVYLLATPLAQSVGWSFLGTVFRLLQFAGAHRKITAVRLQYPLHIEEAWRRSWWTAYSLDREMAAMFGRPVAVQDEDFDTDPPLPLDDDVLLQGRSADGKLPEQPSGKPPQHAGYLCRLKLDEIIGKTLRTIYAISKAKTSRGMAGKGWDQLIVADLDSMLNQWLDTVPAHLRYDPDEPNEEWLIQSTQLHAKYYYAQILVHRPFIVGPRVHSSLNFPSLAIVTNAARLSVQMLHNLCRRGVVLSAGYSMTGLAFECGCVLQLVRWGSKRSGLRTSSGAMEDINKCFKVLEELESFWPLAGKLNDLLRILLKASDVGDEKEDGRSAQTKRKARQDAESDLSATGADIIVEGQSTESRPMIGGSNRGKHTVSVSSASRRDVPNSSAFSLPLSTQDLGVTTTSATPDGSSADDSPSAAHLASSRDPKIQDPNQQNQSSFPAPSQQMGQDTTQAQSSEAVGNSRSHDWRQQRLIESLANYSTSSLAGGGDGLDSAGTFNTAFPSPLDLPTFSSALFAQAAGAAAVGNGGQGSGMAYGYSGGVGSVPSGGNARLTPGFSSLFGSTGMTPFLEYGSIGGTIDQQPSQLQQGSSGLGIPGQGTDQQGQGPFDQQQGQNQQGFGVAQGGGGSGGESDPFGHVFRDLWAAQDFFNGMGGAGDSSSHYQF